MIAPSQGSGLDLHGPAELKQLASPLESGPGAMRKSHLIDAIRSAQRGPGADAPRIRQARQWHRSPQACRATRDVANALDELQRTPREASDEREEAHMLDNPVQPELVAATQPTHSTPDQRQEPVETADGGQARGNNGAPQDGSDSQQVSDRAAAAPEAAESRAEEGEPADGARENRQNDRQNRRGRDQSQGRESQQRDNQGRDNQGRDNQGRDNQGRDTRAETPGPRL